MDIELPIEDLKKTITEALEHNKKQNEEIWKLYVKKVGEYSKYVSAFTECPQKPKQQPYLQLEDTRSMKEALDALRLHIGQTIKIDDREYRELLEGARRMRAGGIAHMARLSSLKY